MVTAAGSPSPPAVPPPRGSEARPSPDILGVSMVVVGALLVALVALADVIRGRPIDLGVHRQLLGMLGAVLLADGGLRLRTPSPWPLWRLVTSDRRAGLIVAMALGLWIAGLQLITYRAFFVDDAFITFRYAQNLARGHGVSWNPGAAPVEGFSNFLWMLILSAAIRLGADPLAAARGLSALCLAGSLVAVRQLAVAATGTRRWANVSILAMAVTPQFAYWSTSGLETQSVVLLAILYFLAFDRELEAGRLPWRSALCADLLYLSRPDVPLFMVLSAVPVLLARDRRAVAWLARLAALALPAALLFQAWRWARFGRLFPNTVAAKWAPLMGQAMVLEYVQIAFPFLAIALLGMTRSSRRFERQMLVCSLGFLLALLNVTPHVAYFGRLFLPLLGPLMALLPLAALLWERSSRDRGTDPAARTRISLAAMVLLALMLLAPYRSMLQYGRTETEGYHHAHELLAQTLKRNFPPDALLAIAECGVIPYRSGMRTLDIWGLCDRRIAEKGFDAGYVMAARPDAIVLHSYDRDAYVPHEAFESALHTAMVADGSYRLVGRWYYYGYWLWLFSRTPLH